MASPPDSPDHPTTEETIELPIPTPPNVRIGRYKLIEKIGAGGMGEIYLAEDAQLDRKIALKLLPARFTEDPDRVRRFVQEAKAASALNHPNIITIYEIGEANGVHYIVTEYIQGQTLRQRMEHLTIALALDVATQMANALKAAHEAGIVHRDIKPENVMVRPDGLVKVVDFGIAKLIDRPTPLQLPPAAADHNDEETVALNDFYATKRDPYVTNLPEASDDTAPGIIMGTVTYMSPEQLRGQKVDARADIFSLGVVLYEVIAGRSPFAAGTQADVIAAILERVPAPLADYRPEAPGELERIVSRALVKDRDKRYQTVQEMLLDLTSLKQEIEFAAKLQSGGVPVLERSEAAAEIAVTQTTSGAEVVTSGIKRYKRNWTLALLVFIAAIAVAGWWLYNFISRLQSLAKSAGAVFEIIPFTTFQGNESLPSFSPDGKRIAFSWNGEQGDNTDIYVKQIGTEGLQRLTTDSAADTQPCWSPDGLYIAFLRQTADAYVLYLMPSIGGAERQLTELSLLPPIRFDVVQVGWSPDGEWLAVGDRASPQEPYSIFIVARDSGEKRRLTSPSAELTGDLSPAVSPDGKTVAYRHFESGGVSEIYVIPVAGGEPKRLTFSNVAKSSPAWTPDGRDILFLSESGSSIGLWRMPAAGGPPERVETAGQSVTSFAISPQGNRLAWAQTINDSNIWQVELSGTTARKQSAKMLISSTKGDTSSQFSPDGKRIVLGSTRSGRAGIWISDDDGHRLVQLISFDGGSTGSPRWSPDGRWIIFDGRVEGNVDIYMINAEGGKPRRLTTEPSEDMVPSFSRDGQWIYFCSNRSGAQQVWKMPVSGGQAVQVTNEGGFDNVESPNGQYIYYAKERGKPGIWRVPVAGGEETLVLNHHRAGLWRQWAVVEQGIFFITAETDGRPLIEFFSFVTGKVSLVLTLDRRLPDTVSGLSVAPDGRRLIWTQLDQISSDITLMENFR